MLNTGLLSKEGEILDMMEKLKAFADKGSPSTKQKADELYKDVLAKLAAEKEMANK